MECHVCDDNPCSCKAVFLETTKNNIEDTCIANLNNFIANFISKSILNVVDLECWIETDSNKQNPTVEFEEINETYGYSQLAFQIYCSNCHSIIDKGLGSEHDDSVIFEHVKLCRKNKITWPNSNSLIAVIANYKKAADMIRELSKNTTFTKEQKQAIIDLFESLGESDVSFL